MSPLGPHWFIHSFNKLSLCAVCVRGWGSWQRSRLFPKGRHLLGRQIVIKQTRTNKSKKKKNDFMAPRFHERKNTGAVMRPLKGPEGVSVS